MFNYICRCTVLFSILALILIPSSMFLQGLETVDNSYFITEDNIGMLKLAKEANTILVHTATN